jgi:hypothetical protein
MVPNDFMCEFFIVFVHEISQNSCRSKQMIIIEFLLKQIISWVISIFSSN